MQRFSRSYDFFFENSYLRRGSMWQLNADEAQDDIENTLYLRFASPILAYLCQQVSNEQDAEDLLLEVFVAALNDETFSRLPAERQLAWLRRVARNKVIDRYRHIAQLSMVPLELALETEDEELSPAQHAEKRETYDLLYQALKRLSPIQQELLGLRYGTGLRLVEIADLFAKPEGTVRSLLNRTLHQLRLIYDQLERGEPL
jgi:RNA polymerase sigma-70 factor (ECF subfamily)